MCKESFEQRHMQSNGSLRHHESPVPDAPSQASTNERAAKELEVALAMLKKKDDTSRFVGLALLKPVLEQKLSDQDTADSGDKRAIVQRSWDAIPAKFLDRLLKAKRSDKKTMEETKEMIALAVSVMHAFMTLLESPHEDEKFIDRIPLLMAVVHSSPPATKAVIMDIIHRLATTRGGYLAMFDVIAEKGEPDQKPTSYLFVTMLLIDIQSTIPSLQEKLHSNEYPATSDRLAKSYDIISAFLGFLVHSLDKMETDGSGPSYLFSAALPADLIPRLRVNISETMSLTIEHLRDRFDSSTAGASGLHPSARSTSEESTSDPLTITWETSTGIHEDPLTLSQLRTLSLWLREDKNEMLRKEAAGIMDVLLALYQNDDEQDFRGPVCVALQGIVEADEGVEAFLHQDGWRVLYEGLEKLASRQEQHLHGEEIIGVLWSIIESQVAGSVKEEWMPMVALASEALAQTTTEPQLSLVTSISQLAIGLLMKARPGLQSSHKNQALGLFLEATTLLAHDDVTGATRDGLKEVVEAFKRMYP